jgi:hypothetical protein
MYEDDDEYRNVNGYDDDDDYDGRNAFWRKRRKRRVVRPRGPRPWGYMTGPSPYGMAPYAPPVAPWEAPPPPIVDRLSGNLKLGLIVDAASQVLASMAGLPAAPTAIGDLRTDMANLITYQQALAQHAKRDEQIRTVGALAKLFLV